MRLKTNNYKLKNSAEIQRSFLLFLGQNNHGDFVNIRTDLILEQSNTCGKIKGVQKCREIIGTTVLDTVKIVDEYAADILKKPVGTYCTVTFPRLDLVCDTADIINATIKSLKTVFENDICSAFVIGLGNTDITPDALGPFVADRVLATRHLSQTFKRDLGLDNLKSVCTLCPNVLGKTGIESYDLITAAASKTKPDVIIAIDALACREPERLCRTIQISNTGICPGAGVNNSRKELNQNTIGIPVIAVGVPTVIDANHFFDTAENMMVTPKEIDLLVEKAAQILSRAINAFLQPELDAEIIESLT